MMTYDQNGQGTEGPGALIEEEAIRHLRSLLSLPEGYSGNLVSSGTMANTSCLVIALQRLGTLAHVDLSEQGRVRHYQDSNVIDHLRSRIECVAPSLMAIKRI
jgi:glutamate/tyrosine decarboxylase-like PLP-dependent enzyme